MKKVLLHIINIILIPILITATFGISWYVLPSIQLSGLGIKIASILSETNLFFIILSSIIASIGLKILNLFISKPIKAKVRNFYNHIHAWLITLSIVTATIYGFVFINPLFVESLEITITRKIGIGITLGALILMRVVSNKIHNIVNRKIQTYETAKELNTQGRSSIIFVNVLKIFEFMFPEMLTLLLLSLFVSWNISSYFIAILVACFVIFVNKIAVDLITRNELKEIKEQEQNALAKKISDNMKGE